MSTLNAELDVFLTIVWGEIMILYRPTLHEKGWKQFSEDSFTHEFDKVFKSEDLAIKYAQKWLDFEYSQDFVRIPKGLEISCDEFVLTENI